MADEGPAAPAPRTPVLPRAPAAGRREAGLSPSQQYSCPCPAAVPARFQMRRDFRPTLFRRCTDPPACRGLQAPARPRYNARRPAPQCGWRCRYRLSGRGTPCLCPRPHRLPQNRPARFQWPQTHVPAAPRGGNVVQPTVVALCHHRVHTAQRRAALGTAPHHIFHHCVVHQTDIQCVRQCDGCFQRAQLSPICTSPAVLPKPLSTQAAAGSFWANMSSAQGITTVTPVFCVCVSTVQ